MVSATGFEPVNGPYEGRVLPARLHRQKWCAMLGSNQRHPACKAGALPTELIAHLLQKLVRRTGIEPVTSPLSGVRSTN